MAKFWQLTTVHLKRIEFDFSLILFRKIEINTYKIIEIPRYFKENV